MGNALNITPTNHAKVVETENSIVLMGNLYQKEDLSCISKTGCTFNISVGNNTLNINTYMNITGSHRLGERDKRLGIVSDPYIANRYYYMINNHYSNVNNAYSYLISSEETGDGDITIKGNCNIQNIEWREILDIDENYIYASGIHLANGGIYLYKILKSDMTATSITNVTETNRAKINLIYKDETYIFFLMYGVYRASIHNRFYICRYNKSNAEYKTHLYNAPIMTTIGNTTGENYEYKFDNTNLWMETCAYDIQDFYKEGDKYYWCFPQRSGTKLNVYDTDGEEGNANNNLMIVCYDSTKNIDEGVTFRTSNGIQDNEKLMWKNESYHVYRFWIIDNYLYYALYDEKGTDVDMIKYQGIHVFKIKPGFNLEYVDKIQISTKKNIISMVYNSDKSILLVGYMNSFEIMTYNKTTHLFEKANKELNNIISVGFDTMDRLWYQNSNGGVYCENMDDPQEVHIEFARPYYTYEGHDISTYLMFSAKSYTSKVPEGRYILTLSGNAHFDETGTETLTIKYKGDDTIHYPITITGPKRITCSTVFEKVWE